MMNGWGDGWGMGWGGGWWLMLVLGIIFLIALIVGIVYLAKSLSSGGQGPATDDRPMNRYGDATQPQRESPQDILQRRYAAGEIDREEYQSRLRDLSS
jgi:putative membrane protein